MKNRKLNICVVQPNKDAYSETFIRNHIEYLPANVFNTYGAWWPEFDNNHKSLAHLYTHRNLISKAAYYGYRILPQQIFIRISSIYTGYPLKSNDLLKAAFKYYLKKNNIDVVLAEYGMKGTIVMDTCSELKIPLVVHFHGYDAHNKTLVTEFETSYKKMFKQADAFIVVSKYMYRALLNLGAPLSKTFLIHYGVNDKLFLKTDVAQNNPILLSVGRFADTKAPQITILAFQKALDIAKKATLIMLGDGPLLESCKTLAMALGINDKIEFKGKQSPFEVAAAMQQARAFVLHSIVTSNGDAEGTPNVIIEAASSGLPVISTKHAGIPDIIEHGKTGFLVEEKNVDRMAKYMILLLEDKELAAKMGVASRRNIEKNFLLQKQISKLMDVINNTIKVS